MSAITPSKSMSRKPVDWGLIGSYFFLFLLALAYLGPLLMLVNTSLKTMPSFMKDATNLATELHFKNFVDAWNKANFAKYLVNTILYTFSATAIYIAAAVFVAFPIARGYVKHANWLLTLFVIALFLPPALIPQFQLILNIGLYNNPIGYILLFLVNPMGIIILVNYIKTLPRELDEAAALEGCSYFRFVWAIVLPLIRPAIATVIVLHAIGIWNEIIAPTIYLTNKNYYPITRGLIVFQGVYGSNWPTLAAAVLMLTFPMLILFVFLQRYIISGLTAGAVKG
ncbi:carbohydrate ABC transporter membrane protein 2, CUT1 family [Longilinea arvoryzae]|uniref:Carbohydrate ABC transporter membrane protein 2, CUT1 family n=1 Tax=Longilinea arvoryzae TaxID=360412 RepID=A0A0S7BJ29_9CHLR|nr:carbohydrate ABC transporter permease [Longilinea arvoryzae]GAP15773.1 carbohydrate ABC transporter membrane protein 2, CUT1 family [Longilinea arvoryzae]